MPWATITLQETKVLKLVAGHLDEMLVRGRSMLETALLQVPPRS